MFIPTWLRRSMTLASLVAFLGLSACGLLPEVQDETAGWSAQKIYSEAKDNLSGGNYERAIKLYETLESRYPYGRYAQQAQLDIAYAYYKDNEALSATNACDRFIKLHPNHPNVDYAYFLKGLVNFSGDSGLFGGLVEQDLSERDQKAAKDSFDAFKELTTRFPDSKYTPDALARMKYLVNTIAGSEIHAAKYYLRREAYVAAANRAQNVVTNYPTTPAVEDALAIMAVSYDKLGVNDLRDDARRVLKLNYPNSKYNTQGIDLTGKSWWKFW
jgi:outer membrane protein assembly factor BamD